MNGWENKNGQRAAVNFLTAEFTASHEQNSGLVPSIV
jgi:hypothetical protein